MAPSARERQASFEMNDILQGMTNSDKSLLDYSRDSIVNIDESLRKTMRDHLSKNVRDY